MDWKPPNAWVLRPSGGAADVHNAQHPINGYQTIDLTNWDPTAGDPVPAAGLIVRQNINGIQHFVQSQRLLYGTGIIPVLNNIRQLNGMTAQYINQFGREQIIYNVSPVSQNPQPTGPYVLIQFAATDVSGNYSASSPTGSALSSAIDPDGTECPLTLTIGSLPQGAKIVYQKQNLTITPNTSYWVYLTPEATFVTTTVDLGSCSGSTNNLTEALALITPTLPSDITIDIGYHTSITLPNGGGSGPWSTESAAAASLTSLNGGGPGTFGGATGYSTPDNVTNDPSGPWECFNISGYYQPYTLTTGTFYDASFNATYVIQLPEITGPTTAPAFSINTTGYPWYATISVFDSKFISVDPTNPSFPLKWTKGSPPPGADGMPWSPRGTPSTDITKAAIFSIFYEDTGGTAANTSYPFVVTSQPHLGPGVPVVPVSTTISPLNYANQIIQVWPTFLSGINVFGSFPNDWNVNYYVDVPYGRTFRPPDSWGWSAELLTTGPLALLTSSDVNY